MKEPHDEFAGLPGHELVAEGLADLNAGRISEYALLLQVAAPRLRRLGISIDPLPGPEPYEHRLFSLLEEKRGDDAYSSYNSLIRRIARFARALEREVSACAAGLAEPEK